MPSFWKHVNQVIKEADIIIEVLDARSIKETRNPEIEYKVKEKQKRLLYVITKCDLVDIEKVKNEKIFPSVFISSRDHLGTTILKKKILEMSRGENVIVGVVGYPNVGKSSLINALSGKGSARTSAESGYTKGLQKIKVDNKIMLLDTPGVFPHKEKDDKKHGRSGAVDFAKIKEPELAALHLIESEINHFQKFYKIKENNPEEILRKIAIKFKLLKKGNKPDIQRAARFLLKEWQIGKMR